MMGATLDHLARMAICLLALSACYAEGVSTPTPARGAAAPAADGSSLDASAWRGTHPRGMAELMEGRFAGVDVRSVPGGGVSIRIRGVSSLMLGTEPLYVVDGMPELVGPGGALEGLSPDDIERIEVLRGPAAAGLWGGQAANGVILITTRRR